MHTHDTVGTGSSMLQYAEVQYHTCTHTTHFGNTAGILIPVSITDENEEGQGRGLGLLALNQTNKMSIEWQLCEGEA